MLDIFPVAGGANAPPALCVKGLTKAYGDRAAPILNGVDMTIQSGERVALIGSNGSGKSTLLKCLIGLHPASGGTIEILGESFQRAPSTAQRVRLRQQTGFVFQKHCLVGRRTALSNVVHGMMGAPGSWRAFSQVVAPAPWRARAMEALEEVRLADRAMTRVDTLSGGQQQRVAIARALMRRPPLVIADEPAASLDPVAGREVMALFADLCAARGITLLFTSHDMDHARAYADRILALKDGRILLNRPSNAITDADLAETFDG